MGISAIEQIYRRYAQFYDFAFGAAFQPGRKATVDRMACGPGERILEVGIGTGLSLPLYPKDVLVTGIDISSGMLAQARDRIARERRDNNVKLSVMDAGNLQFEDNSFDKVVAMYVAFAIPDPKQLVDEMRRVCKPNGRVILVNHFHSQKFWLGALEGFIAPLSRQLGFCPDFSLDQFLAATGLQPLGMR